MHNEKSSLLVGRLKNDGKGGRRMPVRTAKVDFSPRLSPGSDSLLMYAATGMKKVAIWQTMAFFSSSLFCGENSGKVSISVFVPAAISR